jgi:hypothetical protein
MELDAFSARLGSSQGRIAPVNASPGSGDFAFILGDDDLGRLAELAPGDRAEVSQSVDLTGQTLVRAHIQLNVPKGLDPELAWEASILVDGVKSARFTCTSGRKRIATDMAANVSKLAGTHMVSIRLELAGV